MKEINALRNLNACREALEWLKLQPDYATAWGKCERGDWMLWLLRRKINIDDEAELRKLTLAKAKSVELVLHLMKDKRSKEAVKTAILFSEGEATREQLAAAAAAAAYAAAADAADADAAAYAAAYAAAAAAAAYAAADDAAAYAAYAADDAARKNILLKSAEIIRGIYPNPPKL